MKEKNTREYAHSESAYLLRRNDSRNRHVPTRLRKAAVFVSCILQLVITSGIGFGLSVMYAELVVVFNAKRADAALMQSLNLGLSTSCVFLHRCSLDPTTMPEGAPEVFLRHQSWKTMLQTFCWRYFIAMLVAFTGIIFTSFIEKLGPGRSIAIGGIVSSTGLFISGFAHGLPLIILCTGVLSGIGMSVNFLSAFITTSAMFPDNASFFLIALSSGHSIGQFTVPLLFDLFISQYSWSGAFILISAVSLHYIPCGIIIQSSMKDFVTERKKSTATSHAFCDITLLRDIIMWFLLMVSFLLYFTFNVESWFIVDHALSLGFKRESGSMLISGLGIGSFIGRFLGGVLQYAIKWPSVYHWIYLFSLSACFHGLIINLHEFWSLFVSCLLYGVLLAMTSSLLPAVIFEASGAQRYPRAMALINFACGLGDVLGPLLGGFIKDVFGVYDVMFYIAAGGSVYISATAMIISCIINNRKLRAKSEPLGIEVENKALE